MRRIHLIFLIGLFLNSGSGLAQTVYLRSSEPCVIAAYPAPNTTPLPEKLSCRKKVTILERQGSFLRVELDDDKIVWVDDANTSPDVPAELEGLRLMENQKKIEAEIEMLNDQVTRLSQQSEKLIETLMKSNAASKAVSATE